MTADLLSRYDQLRSASRDINERIVRVLTGDETQSAGERLGLVQEGTLIFSDESDMSVLMDHAIHFRGEGPSAAERFFAVQHKQLDGAERDWAEATTRARFRLLQLGSRLGPGQTETRDLLTGESFLLADRGVADTGAPGQAMAGYILEFPGFVVASGGSISMPEVVPDLLLGMLSKLSYPVGTAAMEALSPRRQDALAVSVTGALLAAKRATEGPDGAPVEMGSRQRPSVMSRLQRRPSRNAPCPCGSGRRYKACCGKELRA